MAEATKPDKEGLLRLGAAIAAAAPDRLRLARHEADAFSDPDPEAATFLKLDGRRLGRDLELYAFMATIQESWQPVLPDLASEIVLPLKDRAPEAYAVGVEGLLAMGRAIYDPERMEAWADIFGEPAAPAP